MFFVDERKAQKVVKALNRVSRHPGFQEILREVRATPRNQRLARLFQLMSLDEMRAL
jgi:hypothetical protein